MHTDVASAAQPKSQGTIWLLAGFVLLDFTVVGFITPVMPGMVRALMHYSRIYGAVTGGLLALGAALQFVFGTPLGVLSDRFGRKPVLFVSTAGLAAANLLRGVAPNIEVFTVATVISGVTSATSAVALAAASDCRSENKAQAFELIGAATGAGFILGPLLGGIVSALGAQVTCLAAAALGGLTAVLVLIVLPETLAPVERGEINWLRANPFRSLGSLARASGRARLTMIYFVLQCALALFPACFVLYASGPLHWSALQTGAVVAALAAVYVLGQAAIAGPLAARFGAARASGAGMGFGVLGYVLLSVSSATPLVLVALAAIGLSAIAQPTLRGILSAAVKTSEQGELQGGLESFSALARMIGPALFGIVFSYGLQLGAMQVLRAPFAVTALLLLAGLLLLRPEVSARKPAPQAAAAN